MKTSLKASGLRFANFKQLKPSDGQIDTSSNKYSCFYKDCTHLDQFMRDIKKCFCYVYTLDWRPRPFNIEERDWPAIIRIVVRSCAQYVPVEGPQPTPTQSKAISSIPSFWQVSFLFVSQAHLLNFLILCLLEVLGTVLQVI